MPDRTVTITSDSGVYRATSGDATATGETEALALVALANKVDELGWDWAKPEPEPVKPEAPKANTTKEETSTHAKPNLAKS